MLRPPRTSVPPGTLSSTGHRTGLTTQINIHPEHSHTRLQEGQYESSVPTTADRVAQTVARLYLEPQVEPVFHPDSYGYRPGKSALDAVAACRKRCWRGGLGDRYGHPGVLRHRALGPRAQGGRPPHLTGPAVDFAVCGAVAQSATPARRWHPGGPGSRDPAGQYCLVKLRREYGYAEACDSALWCRCGVSP